MRLKLMSWCLLLALSANGLLVCAAWAQSTNPGVREYGGNSLKRTSVDTRNNTSAVREYGNKSLVKSSAHPGDSDYQSYVDNLEKRVSGIKGPEKFLGQVIITFIVDKAGTISDAKVVKSSNMQQIDASALSAVKSAGAFGAMPKFRTKPVLVQITFDGTSSSTTTRALVKNP